MIHTKTFEQINIIYKFQSIVKFWYEVMGSSLNLSTEKITHKRYEVTIHNGSTAWFDGWGISHTSTVVASTFFKIIYPLFNDFSETVVAYFFFLLRQTRYWRPHSNRNFMYVFSVVQHHRRCDNISNYLIKTQSMMLPPQYHVWHILKTSIYLLYKGYQYSILTKKVVNC